MVVMGLGKGTNSSLMMGFWELVVQKSGFMDKLGAGQKEDNIKCEVVTIYDFI